MLCIQEQIQGAAKEGESAPELGADLLFAAQMPAEFQPRGV